ncbi:phosphatidylinositol-specific phospholipase C/glycerophosphodiester phosphodiesterase family protein [Enterocloster aldenensis]|uniref:phosphatidylinositol-specific phospholipase C/glycerophosphodiester phosphodiesterase family protein n=1 Tax=Enterocloster aldenensis TaxID=358742 RepID=UPI004028E88B
MRKSYISQKSILFFSLFILICILALLKFRSMYGTILGNIQYNRNELLTAVADLHDGQNQLNRRIEDLEFTRRRYSFDNTWISNGPLVAHAFGGIRKQGMIKATNSLEAFEENYMMGYRVFEVDFELTSTEYAMIASHDENHWREITGMDSTAEYSLENFHATKLYGTYTPLDIKQVINLMLEYPDVYIITDTKYQDKVNVLLGFAQLVKYANEVNPEVLNRIIPQIYNEEMLDWVMDIHKFNSIIYTLYATEKWEIEDVQNFCQQTGVNCVTIWDYLATKEMVESLKLIDVKVGIHTVNDEELANEKINLGVDLIYTDFLNPNDF